MYLNVIITVCGCFHDIASARELGVPLTGNELLCEMVASKSTKEKPGIYAANPSDGTLKCIIPFGRRPVWAPNRKKFLYWYDGARWIADIEKRIVFKVNDIVMTPDTSEDMRTYWTPNSNGIVMLYSEYPYPSYLPSILDLSQDGWRRRLWSRNVVDQVGAISISSDYRYAAYESQVYLTGTGPIASKIRIATLSSDADGSREFVEVIHHDLQGLFCRKPQWQPNGSLIAFEAFSPLSHSKQVYIYDHNSKSVDKLDDYVVQSEKYKTTSTQFVSWSPKGDDILVMHEYPDAALVPHGPALLRVYHIATDAQPELQTGGSGSLHDACWSPDGSMIAYLRNSSLDVTMPMNHSLTIWKRKVGNNIEVHMPVKYPDGLLPVYLNW